jgi:hypothetical protein
MLGATWYEGSHELYDSTYRILNKAQLGQMFMKHNTNCLCFENLRVTRECIGDMYYITLEQRDNRSNIQVMLHSTSMNPLHKQYGENGLKLRQLIYRDKQSEGVYYDNYIVDKMEFNIIKDDEVTGQLTLSAKELIKYLIVMDKDEYKSNVVSNKFLKNSDLSKINIVRGFPVFTDKSDREDSNYGIIKSTEHKDEIDKWLNKIMISSGDCVKCNYSVLSKCSMANTETLTIPAFNFVEPTAFSNSTIKEIRITSPETILLPYYIGSNPWTTEIYRNKFSGQIKVTSVYDKEKDIPLFPFELNPVQKKFVLGKLYNENIDMTIRKSRFPLEKV